MAKSACLTATLAGLAACTLAFADNPVEIRNYRTYSIEVQVCPEDQPLRVTRHAMVGESTLRALELPAHSGTRTINLPGRTTLVLETRDDHANAFAMASVSYAQAGYRVIYPDAEDKRTSPRRVELKLRPGDVDLDFKVVQSGDRVLHVYDSLADLEVLAVDAKAPSKSGDKGESQDDGKAEPKGQGKAATETSERRGCLAKPPCECGTPVLPESDTRLIPSAGG